MPKNSKISEKKRTDSRVNTLDPPPENAEWDVAHLVAEIEAEEADFDCGSYLNDTEDFLPYNWTGMRTKKEFAQEREERSLIADFEKNISTALDHDISTPRPCALRSSRKCSQLTFRPTSSYAYLASSIEKNFTSEISPVPTTSANDAKQCALQGNSPTYPAIKIPNGTILLPPAIPTPSQPQHQLCYESESLQEKARSFTDPLAVEQYDAGISTGQWSMGSSVDVDDRKQRNGPRTTLTIDLEQQIHQLQNELTNVERGRQKANLDLRKQRQLADKLLDEKRDQKRDFDRSLKAENTKSAVLQEEVAKLKGEVEQLTATILPQLSQIASASSAHKKLEGEMATRSAQINTLQTQNFTLCRQYNGLKTSSEASLATASARRAVATTQADTATTAMKELKKKCDKLVSTEVGGNVNSRVLTLPDERTEGG
jgi:hypothetical protein